MPFSYKTYTIDTLVYVLFILASYSNVYFLLTREEK
ncbi:hypothetical protein ABTJ_p0052 (plasmid) [Acinetobacter baumannii MDR-TJ]|nr:hypothetical protein ABTJ_p0052 [Acinetobacter baumannii MDR-TJ]